jgi:hypothetical protein
MKLFTSNPVFLKVMINFFPLWRDFQKIASTSTTATKVIKSIQGICEKQKCQSCSLKREVVMEVVQLFPHVTSSLWRHEFLKLCLCLYWPLMTFVLLPVTLWEAEILLETLFIDLFNWHHLLKVFNNKWRGFFWILKFQD